MNDIVHRYYRGDITLAAEVVQNADAINNTASIMIIQTQPEETGRAKVEELQKTIEEQSNIIVTLNNTKKELAENLKSTAEKLLMVEDILNHSAEIIDQQQIERNQTKDLIEWVNEGYNKRKRKGETTLIQAMDKDFYKKGTMPPQIPNFDNPIHTRKRHKPTGAKEIEGVCKVLAKGFEPAKYSLTYTQTLQIDYDNNSK